MFLRSVRQRACLSFTQPKEGNSSFDGNRLATLRAACDHPFDRFLRHRERFLLIIAAGHDLGERGDVDKEAAPPAMGSNTML